MPVIAMTREMGSLGRDIALGLAEETGIQLVQHEVVEHVADKMHLGASAVDRFLEGEAGLLERWNFDGRGLSLFTAEEIYELASTGNVLIRGWGAAHLLRSVPHVLSVRVCAPMEQRIAVLMERIGLDDDATARREIEKNDAAHTRAMSRLGHANWQNPLNFDVVVNTAKIPVDVGVALLKGLLQQPAFAETDASRAMLMHLKLRSAIRAALKGDSRTQSLDTLFDVSVGPGTGEVRITGLVDNREQSRHAEEIIRGLPGVTALRNDLMIANRMGAGS